MREKGIDLTTEKKLSNIWRTKSLQSISSIMTKHLHRATISSILTLFEKKGHPVLPSSLNKPTKSSKTP